ncbi:nucleotide-diphospho-sugar transferase [Podospora aff. communis PSN243]|uniref:Nucleotide-diphospho-sugar transferase n=1 Tax=Podospora aff. communis PSN243 TaxID=3040156 RepID=A0AAV9GMG8_9PEZI|nr:nucleotide-diphospho-sugar transferase [Podospora aff. communis PSN243]
MAAPIILASFWLWSHLDREITQRDTEKYRPAPLPVGPAKFTLADVSVITCALKPEPSFLRCLESWLRNDPLEVIVVTTPPFLETFKNLLASATFDVSKVKVHVVPDDLPKGFRGQLVHAIRSAKGKLILRVDGHIMWGDKLIINMAACFEDDTIGIAGGDMQIRIENTDTVTPWQVASTRLMSGGRPAQRNIYAAKKFRYGIGGGTVMYRACLYQSSEFEDEFLNDYWHNFCGLFGGRTRLDSGEDNFISRWAVRKGFVCASQTLPETTVTRVPKTNFHPWIMQMVRWERSTIQSFLRYTWEVPTIWPDPFLCRKMFVERLGREFWFAVHLWAWLTSFREYPFLTLLFLAYYIWRTVRGLVDFFRAHPHLPPKYWWAALLADYTLNFIAPWVWLTLGVEEWHIGEKVAANKK